LAATPILGNLSEQLQTDTPNRYPLESIIWLPIHQWMHFLDERDGPGALAFRSFVDATACNGDGPVTSSPLN
jgi:hypothetical protein